MSDFSWLDPRVMSLPDMAALVWTVVAVLTAVTVLRARWHWRERGGRK